MQLWNFHNELNAIEMLSLESTSFTLSNRLLGLNSLKTRLNKENARKWVWSLRNLLKSHVDDTTKKIKVDN